ncbi:hypothetical protein GCM10010106_25700 [Thermopolyspora flexuosa]|jgi:hypothetical protein|uniref:Uncharacterized protein n=1 Tax=Thermopolyspora flexuosa TaxID=103836 RepID=A0A543IVS8_9ACTN|nr:hypothetical protein [Thermopolyspora flexuosa]TQM74678.1 hypothetical protein FHX40_1359 [Thermopolyspora flexuosa]GGM78043.1 hypothetical protein GCM10010106_25700 [Thermopolyspora flexuosa]
MNEGNPPRSLVYLAAAALVVATGLAMWLLPAGMPRLPPTAATGTTTASPERPTPHPPTHSARGPSRPPATASAAAPVPGSDPPAAGPPTGEATTTADPDPADGEAAGCPPPSPRASSPAPLARSPRSGPVPETPPSPTPSPPPPAAAMPGCHSAAQLRPTRSSAHRIDGLGPSG